MIPKNIHIYACSIFSVSLVCVAVTSAQITMNRQWARGMYPTDYHVDGEDVDSSETQHASLPKKSTSKHTERQLTTYLNYIPIRLSSHLLRKLLESIKEPKLFSGLTPVGSGKGVKKENIHTFRLIPVNSQVSMHQSRKRNTDD